MTILLGKENQVFWFMGINDPDRKKIPQVNVTEFNEYGIRKTLAEKDKEVRIASGYTDENMPNYAKEGLVVIIKPCDNSVYKNVVDILDEMKIAKIKSFAWAEVAPVDLTLLDKSNLNK